MVRLGVQPCRSVDSVGSRELIYAAIAGTTFEPNASDSCWRSRGWGLHYAVNNLLTAGVVAIRENRP